MAVTVAVTAAATLVVVIFRQLAIVAEAGRITAVGLEAVIAVAASEASAAVAASVVAVPEDDSNSQCRIKNAEL